jgi:hypothetical protein
MCAISASTCACGHARIPSWPKQRPVTTHTVTHFACVCFREWQKHSVMCAQAHVRRRPHVACISDNLSHLEFIAAALHDHVEASLARRGSNSLFGPSLPALLGQRALQFNTSRYAPNTWFALWFGVQVPLFKSLTAQILPMHRP